MGRKKIVKLKRKVPISFSVGPDLAKRIKAEAREKNISFLDAFVNICELDRNV